LQVEYDSPQVLLQKKGSHFKALVDGSGDKKALYAAAEQIKFMKIPEQWYKAKQQLYGNIYEV
jgi:hypothetical protein